MLKKQHDVFFYSNKTKKFIETKIRNHFQNSIFFFDFKKYENIKLSSSKSTKFKFFDRNKKKNKKNELNINPLLPWNNVNSGPKWYFYPKNFFNKKIIRPKNKIKKILICQGGTDANNNLSRIIKLIQNSKIALNTNLSILAPKNFKIKKKTNFNKSVKIYKNIKNIKKLLCKFDHIITSCGGLSYEINFLGIECTYITSKT